MIAYFLSYNRVYLACGIVLLWLFEPDKPVSFALK